MEDGETAIKGYLISYKARALDDKQKKVTKYSKFGIILKKEETLLRPLPQLPA
ncbi:MAG: hypothetical protein ACTSQE_16640 [Candidatus Heimdallarchaeaceae archaeon]